MSPDASLEWDEGDPQELAERLRDLDAEVKGNMESAMEWATLTVMRTAKIYAPFRKGRLRSDISQEVERIGKAVVAGYVGNNVYYAEYQEFIYTPYLRPAIMAHIDDIEQRFQEAVEDAVDEVAA